MNALVLSEDTGAWTEVDDLDKIAELIATPGNLVWAFGDVTELTPLDVEAIAETFALHPLAVEDAVKMRQRPKLEAYESHLFAVMHQLETIEGQLEAQQISCFIGRRWLLTLHQGAHRLLAEATKRCFKGAKLADQGPSYVMHNLLDTIVDDYQQIADRLEDEIEDIEERALADPRAVQPSVLYQLKQRVARLRRYAFPGERVLAMVIEPNRYNLITERTAALFRDIHDHLLRIIDQVHNSDALADAVIDLQRAEQQEALNQVTKRLTGWAAIIAVPTFIASVYGMNFELIPASGERAGFFVALGLMVVSSAVLYRLFKRKTWI